MHNWASSKVFNLENHHDIVWGLLVKFLVFFFFSFPFVFGFAFFYNPHISASSGLRHDLYLSIDPLMANTKFIGWYQYRIIGNLDLIFWYMSVCCTGRVSAMIQKYMDMQNLKKKSHIQIFYGYAKLIKEYFFYLVW